MDSLHDPARRTLIRSSLLLGLASTLPVGARAQQAAPSGVLRTRSGRVRGVVDRGIQVFKGIPYGADTAPRRFMPALPELPWTGIRDAQRFGASAPQGGADDGPGSED
jgi:para-nitrobenzyl esterase